MMSVPGGDWWQDNAQAGTAGTTGSVTAQPWILLQGVVTEVCKQS